MTAGLLVLVISGPPDPASYGPGRPEQRRPLLDDPRIARMSSAKVDVPWA
jgi:hypothetical protein